MQNKMKALKNIMLCDIERLYFMMKADKPNQWW